MLTHTFCHINGIGLKTEQKLWDQNILSWGDWIEPKGVVLSKRARLEIPDVFERSLDALDQQNPLFFSERLTSGNAWRLFYHFRKNTAYLDIETTGLNDESEITTISLYDGEKVFTYVNGRNLNDFINDVSRFSVLVSYNGKSFDIPFIEKYFNTRLQIAQIDLRFVLSQLGIRGGLKGCEKQLGINRGSLDGVDGSFAVYLWHLYDKYNDEKALETLLAYNIEDTVNLERLLVEACNRNIENTPFTHELQLPYPPLPPIPYYPDNECVQRAKETFSSRITR